MGENPLDGVLKVRSFCINIILDTESVTIDRRLLSHGLALTLPKVGRLL